MLLEIQNLPYLRLEMVFTRAAPGLDDLYWI